MVHWGLGKAEEMKKMHLVGQRLFLMVHIFDIRSADMRKPLPRDTHRRSVRPNGQDIIVSRHDVS